MVNLVDKVEEKKMRMDEKEILRREIGVIKGEIVKR